MSRDIRDVLLLFDISADRKRHDLNRDRESQKESHVLDPRVLLSIFMGTDPSLSHQEYTSMNIDVVVQDLTKPDPRCTTAKGIQDSLVDLSLVIYIS